MHVFNTDSAAIGIAQHAQQFVECELCTASHAAGEEFALKVPNGEAVVVGVQFARKTRCLPTQWIKVGNEVTTYAVRTHEHADLHLLVHHCFFAIQRSNVGRPLHCVIRNSETAEHVFVEVVFAEQQLVHSLQEHATLCTLNDAVVICAGNGDNFRDTKRVQVGSVCTLELSWVFNGSHANDDALTWHKTRHRLNGTDGAGVGDGNVCTLEIGNGEFVVLYLANDFVVGNQEASEVERVCIAQHGHYQVASAVALVDVDRKTHIDVRVAHQLWLAVSIECVGVLHVRHCFCNGANNCVRDDVSERHLAQTMT